MRTDELIRALAAGAGPVEPRAASWRYAAALALGALGALLGLGGALLLSRSLSSLLYSVSPTDPSTLAGVGVLLLATTLVAGYLPARRATRVDPVVALRAE